MHTFVNMNQRNHDVTDKLVTIIVKSKLTACFDAKGHMMSPSDEMLKIKGDLGALKLVSLPFHTHIK